MIQIFKYVPITRTQTLWTKFHLWTTHNFIIISARHCRPYNIQSHEGTNYTKNVKSNQTAKAVEYLLSVSLRVFSQNNFGTMWGSLKRRLCAKSSVARDLRTWPATMGKPCRSKRKTSFHGWLAPKVKTRTWNENK